MHSWAGSFNFSNKGTSKYMKASIEGKPGIESPSWSKIAFLIYSSV